MGTLTQVAEHRSGDVTIVRLAGRSEEGDTTLRDLMDALGREGRLRVVLDLHGVEYVDSTCLGTMAAKYLSLRRRGGDLKLLNVPPRAMQLMTITKLTQVFEIYDREDHAIASFAYPAPDAPGAPRT